MNDKQPWQMTRREWDSEIDKARPNIAQSNFTKASGSEALRRLDRLMFLKYGHFASTISTTHRDVIVKALAEGQPVPAEALADYPQLERQP